MGFNSKKDIADRVEIVNSYNNAKALFTEDKLKEILHYTDIDSNPYYESYLSKCIYELMCAAKAVGKSFTAGGIVTIYRLIHEPNFNSVYCRNFYKHIKNTLIPMFKKIIDLLKHTFGIDLTLNFVFLADRIDFYRDSEEIPQTIYLQNWEYTQAFQGLTLPKMSFYFGEVVIDEPIEDPNDTTVDLNKLQDIYQNQKEKLPLILSNTIFRVDVPADVKIKVRFFLNPFDDTHFLFTDYIYKLMSYTDEVIAELENEKSLQFENNDFKNGHGIIFTAVTRYFTPLKTIGKNQINEWENLKQENPRLYYITVIGVPYQLDNVANQFYLKNKIFNENGEYLKDWIYHGNIKKEIANGHIIQINDGVDIGAVDATSWFRVALRDDGTVIFTHGLAEILDRKIKKEKSQVRLATAQAIMEIMRQADIELGISKFDKDNNRIFDLNEFSYSYTPLVLLDNDIMVSWLNSAMNPAIYEFIAYPAIRRDIKERESFGIVNRQNFWRKLFETQKILFAPGLEWFIDYLALQVVPQGELQRDETINKHIYDPINAGEYALSGIYKEQTVISITLPN